MRKAVLVLLLVLGLSLALCSGAAAQDSSPAAVVQTYYAALGQAAASGDFSQVLALFADDATVSIPALGSQGITGKEAMRSAFAGIGSLMKDMTVLVDHIEVDGDTAVVGYRLVSSGQQDVPAEDTFIVRDGKIVALTVSVAVQAPTESSSDLLPTTGGFVLPLQGMLPLAGLSALSLLAPLARRK